MFLDAVRERRLEYNPCSPVKPLKRTEKPARETVHRALTIEEQKSFFACERCKNSFYYDAFKFMCLTGMRAGEVGALYVSDIYDDKIHVNRTITKTESGGYRVGDDPKTWHGKRTIPLNDSIREVIAHQMQINKMLDGDKVTEINARIFKAPQRGLLMATPADREITRICKLLNLEKFTCHAFRATFATRCIEQGMQPRTLQELLGHSDFGITMNLYGQVEIYVGR